VLTSFEGSAVFSIEAIDSSGEAYPYPFSYDAFASSGEDCATSYEALTSYEGAAVFSIEAIDSSGEAYPYPSSLDDFDSSGEDCAISHNALTFFEVTSAFSIEAIVSFSEAYIILLPMMLSLILVRIGPHPTRR
jgi:hypothetical protein